MFIFYQLQTAVVFFIFFLGLQCHGVQPHLVYIFFYFPTNKRNVPHLPCKRFFFFFLFFFLILKELTFIAIPQFFHGILPTSTLYCQCVYLLSA